MLTIAVVTVLVIWGVLAVRSMKKNKGCACSGNCSSCSGAACRR